MFSYSYKITFRLIRTQCVLIRCHWLTLSCLPDLSFFTYQNQSSRSEPSTTGNRRSAHGRPLLFSSSFQMYFSCVPHSFLLLRAIRYMINCRTGWVPISVKGKMKLNHTFRCSLLVACLRGMFNFPYWCRILVCMLCLASETRRVHHRPGAGSSRWRPYQGHIQKSEGNRQGRFMTNWYMCMSLVANRHNLTTLSEFTTSTCDISWNVNTWFDVKSYS